MKQSEIKELSVAELQEKLSETKKSYSSLKLAHAIQLRTVRRTVARIATELTKRELQ